MGEISLENILCVPGEQSLEDQFEAAKILLLPSLWRESGSRSVLEACAHGLPVVASDRGGTPELLGGAMPHPSTIDAWSDMIERLMTDSNFYRIRQAAALKRWRAYKIKSSTRRMIRQIERLVS